MKMPEGPEVKITGNKLQKILDLDFDPTKMMRTM